MKLRKKYFTLFEMLISSALLIVVAVVLLRMFVLTGDYWQHSNNQSTVYIDNKLLFNLMDEDLGNIIYNYENYNDNTKIHAPLYTGEFTPASSSIMEFDGNSKGLKLYFVTRSKRGNDSGTDICKVGYIFYPPLQKNGKHNIAISDNKKRDFINQEQNGMILRVVQTKTATTHTQFTGSRELAAVDDKNSNIVGKYFNFDPNEFKMVVSGVLDFKVDLYKYNSSGSQLELEDSFVTKKGYENIRAVRVSVTMMSPEKCKEYREVYHDKSGDAPKEFLQKYSRTFSRMFWIKPMNSAE